MLPRNCGLACSKCPRDSAWCSACLPQRATIACPILCVGASDACLEVLRHLRYLILQHAGRTRCLAYLEVEVPRLLGRAHAGLFSRMRGLARLQPDATPEQARLHSRDSKLELIYPARKCSPPWKELVLMYKTPARSCSAACSAVCPSCPRDVQLMPMRVRSCCHLMHSWHLSCMHLSVNSLIAGRCRSLLVPAGQHCMVPCHPAGAPGVHALGGSFRQAAVSARCAHAR